MVEKLQKLRKKAKNAFEKDFFQVDEQCGIRKRVDVKLVNNRKSAEKLSAKPNFKHLTIFVENLIAIHIKRTKLKFDKPVYCRMSILRYQQEVDVRLSLR